MDYFYIKALHVIFIVTWFSGLFYIVRLFIYTREAQDKEEIQKQILSTQFKIMSKRLWYGITWPSAILTLVFGLYLLYLYGSYPSWLMVKLCFVFLLFVYHGTLHIIFTQQQNNIFKYSSGQLRIWNEVATVFLVAIVFLVIVKQTYSWFFGLGGLLVLIILLFISIKLYKRFR